MLNYLQEKIAKIAIDIYVIESMGYMVAGTIDNYQTHDTMLESAIIKVIMSGTRPPRPVNTS